MTLLMDKGLVHVEPDGEMRYRLLESIGEYALEQLKAHGEEDEARRAHAVSLQKLAKRAASDLRGPDQATWFRRLEHEHVNLRAALSWLTDHGEQERALRLATSLGYFWWTRGYLGEGKWRLDSAGQRVCRRYH